jgi:hypothetical protein
MLPTTKLKTFGCSYYPPCLVVIYTKNDGVNNKLRKMRIPLRELQNAIDNDIEEIDIDKVVQDLKVRYVPVITMVPSEKV